MLCTVAEPQYFRSPDPDQNSFDNRSGFRHDRGSRIRRTKKNRYPDTYLFGSAFSQNYRIRTRILLDPDPHISRSGSAYIRIRIKANSSMIQIRSSMVGRIRIRNPGLLCTRLVYPYTSHKSSFKHSPIYTFSIRMREGRGGENAMASKASFLMDKDHLLTCFVPRSDKN